VVQIWPGLFVCKQVTVCPGHIWTTWYILQKHTHTYYKTHEVQTTIFGFLWCYFSEFLFGFLYGYWVPGQLFLLICGYWVPDYIYLNSCRVTFPIPCLDSCMVTESPSRCLDSCAFRAHITGRASRCWLWVLSRALARTSPVATLQRASCVELSDCLQLCSDRMQSLQTGNQECLSTLLHVLNKS
jgi:hypothetical protein